MGLKITNAAGDKPSVWLYGAIGASFGGVTPEDFRLALGEIPSKQAIELHIHSDGGVFYDAVAMHSSLKQRKGSVSVIVDGLAASAASLVAMGGTSITMATHAWMMMHEAHGAMYGRAADFREHAEILDALNSEIVSIYAARWKGSEQELRAALDAETWMNAENTVSLGLADRVSESKMAVAARVNGDVFNYKNTPAGVTVASGPIESPAMMTAAEIVEGLESLIPVGV